MQGRNAIPTLYRGIEYRSRLEARWAAFMSNIGWEHTYEPFDGEGYIPDFIVHGDRPLVIEVKPAVTLLQYQDPSNKIDLGLVEHPFDALVVGVSPFVAAAPSLGLAPGWHGSADGHPLRYWDWSHWAVCHNVSDRGPDGVALVGLMHTKAEPGRVRTNPCGCIHHLEQRLAPPPLRARIDKAWSDACNDVKWRGRDAS